MDYFFIHWQNFLYGHSIGDVFCSLLYLSQKIKKNKIALLTHESLVPFIKYIFPDLIDEFIFHPDTEYQMTLPILKNDIRYMYYSNDFYVNLSNNITRFHRNQQPFCNLHNIINRELNLKMDDNLLNNNNDKLIPNNSILLILNRSDQTLLNEDIIETIFKKCSNRKVYIRNVVDNSSYKKSYIKHQNILSYEENLMCLIESCMKKDIKIIMNRCGLVDTLGYISKIPIFIIYPDAWLKDYNFSIHKENKFLNDLMNPNITEYFINNDNSNNFSIHDLEKKLDLFLNK